jgi:hypothetical protein
MVIVCVIFYAATVWGYTETNDNNFFGVDAGQHIATGIEDTFMGTQAGANDTSGSQNTFMGYLTGADNTTGNNNTFVGTSAGLDNTTGSDNTYIGYWAGNANQTASQNTFVGYYAGSSNTTGGNNTYMGFEAGYSDIIGAGNVFLGFEAGYTETGSNKLYIDNCYTGGGSCTSPLIYGEFDTRSVAINGFLGITSAANTLLSLATTSTTGGAGFQFSVPNGGIWYFKGTQDNGFKIRDAAHSKDVMYFQTSTGNVGIGTDSPAYPLEMESGAYVSTGGVWTNASSREYKDNIKDLSVEEAARTFEGLNPVTFTYKKEVGAQHVGFIAEDVPDLVATQDRKGLSPMDIVAVLTKVVQEQQQTLKQKSQVIDKQQKSLESFEAKLAKLESEMQRLKGMNMTARTVEQ